MRSSAGCWDLNMSARKGYQASYVISKFDHSFLKSATSNSQTKSEQIIWTSQFLIPCQTPLLDLLGNNDYWSVLFMVPARSKAGQRSTRLLPKDWRRCLLLKPDGQPLESESHVEAMFSTCHEGNVYIAVSYDLFKRPFGAEVGWLCCMFLLFWHHEP